MYIAAPLLLHLFAAAAASVFVGMAGLPESVSSICRVIVADTLCIPILIRMRKKELEKGIVCRETEMVQMNAGKAGFLLFAFVLGAFCSGAGGFLMRQAGLFRHFSNAVQEELQAAPVFLQVLGPCLIVPAEEELLYRIVLYDRLRVYLEDFRAAFAAAVLFAAGHGNVIQAVYAFPMALLLLWFRRKGGYAACLLCHMGANMFTVWLLFCTSL